MPRARDVVRLFLVSSAPPALLVLSFSGGHHLQPTPPVDSRLRWQWRWCQGSRKRCRGSFSSPEETATSRRYHCCSRLTLYCRQDKNLDSRARIGTAVDDQKKSSTRRSRTINGDTAAAVAAVAGASPGSTRYTIDMDVHPDVADVAVKHACHLSRFLEHHPISAHTEQAYALATRFVRDFHLSRQGSGDGRADLGQVQGLGEEGSREVGRHREEGAAHRLLQRPLPVVLDAGCGTGRSSILLAKSHPHLPVLGVDRSSVRLSKGHRGVSRGNKANRSPLPGGFREGEDVERKGHEQVVDSVVDDVSGGGVGRAMPSEMGPGGGRGGDGGDGDRKRRRRRSEGRDKQPPDNLLLLRADLVDLWILASRDDAWKVEEHSILYPNPYPKRSQLRSRWHGHSVFPVLLGLGGRITLRSNWKSYLVEVCQAVLAISAEGKEVGAAGGGAGGRAGGGTGDGAGGGTTAGEPLLGNREERVLAANSISAGSGGPAGGPATAVAPAEVTAGTAGKASLSELVGGRGENETSGRYVRRSYARGQVLKPRDIFLSKTTGQPATSSGAEAAAKLAGSSSSSSNRALNGAADSMAEVPAAIAAAAASYEASARAGPSLYVPVVPATNFEAKYKAIGETVYELRLEPQITR